jgi:hypothetical protein
VIDSRDISYAFTNLIANDYYSFSKYLSMIYTRADADMQKTTILSAYFVILIARPRGRMISLFGFSLPSKVSPSPSTMSQREGSEQRSDLSEKSKKVGGPGNGQGYMNERRRSRRKDTDDRLETTPPSRRSSSIHQRPCPLLFRLFFRIPNPRHPRILGTFSYNGNVAFRPIGYCTYFRWISHSTGGCCFTLCSAVMLYPGKLEGICLS